MPTRVGFPPPDTIHNRIHRARLLRGMSTKEFAEELKTNRTTPNGWEKNVTPQMGQIRNICRVLKIDIAWLIGGEGQMEASFNNEPPVGAEGSSSNSAR